MFRTILMTAMIFLLSNPLGAADQTGKVPEASSAHGNSEQSGKVTDEYVDSQLDWRSYYLNRIDRATTRDAPRSAGDFDG